MLALMERPPFCEKEAEEEGESWEEAKERSLARGPRCSAGSWARIASANALDAKSSSWVVTEGRWPADEPERGRGMPGVGMLVLPGVGMPETRPLPGVTDMEEHETEQTWME